jgi:hypothetical protein
VVVGDIRIAKAHVTDAAELMLDHGKGIDDGKAADFHGESFVS